MTDKVYGVRLNNSQLTRLKTIPNHTDLVREAIGKIIKERYVYDQQTQQVWGMVPSVPTDEQT
jgi:hypothetical protein